MFVPEGGYPKIYMARRIICPLWKFIVVFASKFFKSSLMLWVLSVFDSKISKKGKSIDLVNVICYDSPAADFILPLEGSLGANEANLGRK